MESHRDSHKKALAWEEAWHFLLKTSGEQDASIRYFSPSRKPRGNQIRRDSRFKNEPRELHLHTEH